jgi:hypothetical protein
LPDDHLSLNNLTKPTRSPEEIIAEIYAARTVSQRAESLGPEETA